ncbi:homeobox protein YbgS [Erwinia sp. OLTSP20]|uniref:protein YbgS n=1 Tax=unclassified Erwinia TaxID=2622719 RepID=UPI000C186B4B|nr:MULTISPECIES: protein YbgS [unclassified Erwinia]PIJ48742.1 homeobox protein YbgS [Erwinia sp. OAMSP11]PIJ69367.1 homeobox protein YbgS [Erwinia sp. OLSSP12]PIJ79201.1 homeobox protein YbgS [Erwinia sp. OLCASP19]PIJ80727.1 homeobox protein YbgS [Erwinia sp. OLMTSP26]PIJ82877.1 homeobox protein YbgS [Erwinia sp. OLMDSP33]
MMNKFAIAILTAAMTLTSGAVLAEDGGNNGTANQAADAGAASGGSEQTLAPKHVDNSKINQGSTSHKSVKHHSKKMSARQIDKNSQCKDGKCPDVNKKVGPGADTKTDGTTQ